jgi:hypothetical protein
VQAAKAILTTGRVNGRDAMRTWIGRAMSKGSSSRARRRERCPEVAIGFVTTPSPEIRSIGMRNLCHRQRHQEPVLTVEAGKPGSER